MFGRGLREAAADEGVAIEQTMERLPQGVRRLAVQLRTAIPVSVLWEVLTDYDHLDRFIPNLSTSELVLRDGATVRVLQVGSQQLLDWLPAQVAGTSGGAQDGAALPDVEGISGRRFRRPVAWTDFSIYELTAGCLGMPIGLIERLRRCSQQSAEKEAERRWTHD